YIRSDIALSRGLRSLRVLGSRLEKLQRRSRSDRPRAASRGERRGSRNAAKGSGERSSPRWRAARRCAAGADPEQVKATCYAEASDESRSGDTEGREAPCGAFGFGIGLVQQKPLQAS